jgi:hypothetical protein
MRTSITHIIDRVAAQVVTIINTGTTSHFHFQKQGYLKGIAYSLNNNTNNVTSVITVLDDEDQTLYTSAALNENTVGYLKPDIALADVDHRLVVTSADPGASGNLATITLLIER